jgi:hypothetical protein
MVLPQPFSAAKAKVQELRNRHEELDAQYWLLFDAMPNTEESIEALRPVKELVKAARVEWQTGETILSRLRP